MNCRPLANYFFSFLLLAGFLSKNSVRILPQEPGPTSLPAVTTRACTADPTLASGGTQKHTKHHLPPDPPPACVEIQGEPLEVQETLQAVAREQQWRIHDNHANEDTWTFVRYLNRDELENYADTKVLVQPVDFENGKAAVAVRTTDIGGEFTRVQVSAHFAGEGKSSDMAMKQPGSIWPLTTRGVLEKEILAALQARFHHMR
jgi:hypothetical protein